MTNRIIKHHRWCAFSEKPRKGCSQCVELEERFPSGPEGEYDTAQPQYINKITWCYDSADGLYVLHEITEEEKIDPNPVEIFLPWGWLRDALRRHLMVAQP